MEDLIRASALLISEDEAGADDVSEIIEDEEETGDTDEEDGGMDAETGQWQ